MINLNKRKTLKTLSVSGLGVAALNFASVSLSKDKLTVSADTQLTESGLSMTHYKNYNGHTVWVRNSNNQVISLQNISPAIIKTPDGEVSIENLFEQGALTIPANSTQAYSITADGRVHRYAMWQHAGNSQLNTAVPAGFHKMEVTGRYDAALQVSQTYLHQATIS